MTDELMAFMATLSQAEGVPMVPDNELAPEPPSAGFVGRPVRDADTLLAAYAAGPFDYIITEKDGSTMRKPRTCNSPRVRDELVVKLREGAIVTVRPRR